MTAPARLLVSVAFLELCACACKPPTDEQSGTLETAVSSSGDSSAQPPGSTVSSDPGSSDASGAGEPPGCSSQATCPCGTLGCACGPGGMCSEGVCNADTGTCTLEQDGMMRVPTGAFWMGCREGFDTDSISAPCTQSQLPYRQVTIDTYWIDRLEVTKGAFRLCIDAGVCAAPPQWDTEWYKEGAFVPGQDDMPAASVTWLQAKTYCEWLGKRLPTDAEWEKAARGTEGRKYPWGAAEPTCAHANFRPWDLASMKPGEPCPYRASYETLTPVGMFCKLGASPYGVCDMSGNVLEWAADGFSSNGYEGLPAENPLREPMQGPVSRRGSGWGSFGLSPGGYSLRASQRQGGGLDDLNETLETGLRCARSG